MAAALLPIPPLDRNTIDRFWGYVDRGAFDQCWLWTRAKDSCGYGNFRIGGRSGHVYLAHRISYALAHGTTPTDKSVLHSCDTPACVNPAHLWLGTQLDNMRDCAAKGRTRILVGDESPWRTHPERMIRGEKQWQAKLNDDAVRDILSSPHLHINELAKRYNVTPTTVHFVRVRRTWKHVTL